MSSVGNTIGPGPCEAKVCVFLPLRKLRTEALAFSFKQRVCSGEIGENNTEK